MAERSLELALVLFALASLVLAPNSAVTSDSTFSELLLVLQLPVLGLIPLGYSEAAARLAPAVLHGVEVETAVDDLDPWTDDRAEMLRDQREHCDSCAQPMWLAPAHRYRHDAAATPVVYVQKHYVCFQSKHDP